LHADARWPGGPGHSRPRLAATQKPPYLVWFGIPPFVTAFVLAAVDPFAGLALLACMAIMAIVLHVLPRHTR